MIAAVAELGEGRERLYAFTAAQVEALEELGVPMRPVNERNIVKGVLEDVVSAGWRLFRPDDCMTGQVCDSGKRDWYDPVIRALPSNALLDDVPYGSTYWLVEKESE